MYLHDRWRYITYKHAVYGAHACTSSHRSQQRFSVKIKRRTSYEYQKLKILFFFSAWSQLACFLQQHIYLCVIHRRSSARRNKCVHSKWCFAKKSYFSLIIQYMCICVYVYAYIDPQHIESSGRHIDYQRAFDRLQHIRAGIRNQHS